MHRSFKCSKCGESKPIQTDGPTGYAVDGDSKICYACMGQIDRQAMIDSGRATLYLVTSHDKNYRIARVTNWPNTLSFPGLVSIGRHNIAGKRYDITFDGPDGYKWHGVTYGDNTQVCHCRRTKKRA